MDGEQVTKVRRGSWLERLGFDSEMTRWDRIATTITLLWPLLFTLFFIVITIYAVRYGLDRTWWAGYWHWWTYFAFSVAIVVTIWFTIGGFRDLRRMYKRLASFVADETDDGRVE